MSNKTRKNHKRGGWEELPPGWEKKYEYPSIYYYNPITQEKRYDMPPNKNISEQQTSHITQDAEKIKKDSSIDGHVTGIFDNLRSMVGNTGHLVSTIPDTIDPTKYTGKFTRLLTTGDTRTSKTQALDAATREIINNNVRKYELAVAELNEEKFRNPPRSAVEKLNDDIRELAKTIESQRTFLIKLQKQSGGIKKGKQSKRTYRRRLH
jgi:hypothetical protein